MVYPSYQKAKKRTAQMGFSQKGKRIILKTYSNLRARFCLHFFGYQCLILSFDFFFLVKKQGNIGYDTKKNGDAVLSRLRRLLSTIWMKFVPVAPRCLEFCLGVKNLLLNCPKYLTLPNMVKIRQKQIFLLWQHRVRSIKLLQ